MIEPRAGLYCRISHDERHDQLGVGRQEQDGRADLERRGIPLHRAYVDDDISGSGLVARPAYDDLVCDLTNGTISVVWAWSLDRLTRGLRQFADLVELCEKAGARVIWQGGEANFASGEGIAELEFRGLMARSELRTLKGRVRRKQEELRQNGQWHGGRPSYGYRQTKGPDGKVHLEIEEAEAAVIREAATRVLAGETVSRVAMDFDRRGIKTKNGSRWARNRLVTILTSARISGRVEHDGQIIRDAEAWPAIIDTQSSDRLRRLLRSSGAARANPRAHLLSGIATCGKCGTPLVCEVRQGRKRYVCRATVGFYGCGRLTVHAEPLEELVARTVIELYDSGKLGAILHGAQGEEITQAERDLAWVGDQLGDLARRRVRERLTPEEVQAEREELLSQREQAQRVLDAAQRSLQLPALSRPLGGSWDQLQVHEQRVLLRAVLDRVQVMPATKVGRGFDPSRVVIDWKV